jgi:hypothetical protein
MILGRRRFDPSDRDPDRDPGPGLESAAPSNDPAPVVIRSRPLGSVVVNPGVKDEPCPRLLIKFRKHIPVDRFESIRCAVRHAIEDRRPVVFEAGVDVYQLIDGRWAPLDPTAPPIHDPEA